MSVVGCRIVVSRKEKLMKTICAFCMNVYEPDTISCYPCKEYKGIMPLTRATLIYLGEDPDEWII